MFGIAVEFVPEGMTAEEARRLHKRKKPGFADALTALGAIGFLIALVYAPIWFFTGRNAQAKEKPHTPVAADWTPTDIPSPTPTATITPTNTPIPAPVWRDKAAKTLFSSPIRAMTTTITATATITPPIIYPTATPTALPTATPTATPNPFDYQIIANNQQPTDLYWYISGWVVEADGTTPRPVAVQVTAPDGLKMLYPRPHNTDVATGHYEFMVAPGSWAVTVLDGKTPTAYIAVGDEPSRYEVSFKFLYNRPVKAARSAPWGSSTNPPANTADPTATSTATPDPRRRYHIYLPIITKSAASTPQPSTTAEPTPPPLSFQFSHHIYLPLVKNETTLE